MSPINFGGDDIAEVTMDGDQIVEITMDGDVVWTAGGDGDWRADTTVIDNFEGYGSQAELEAEWDFGVAPAVYELNVGGAIAHDQDIVAQSNFAHAPNVDVLTPWDSVWSAVVRPGDSNNSPGISVQHQPNWDNRLDDCYWCQADFGNNELRIFERVNGNSTLIASDAIPTGLSMANGYRIQVDLPPDNDVRARLFNFGDAPGETPLANTGFASPSTVHTGGHIMLDAGREGAGNTHFDNVRQHQ